MLLFSFNDPHHFLKDKKKNAIRLKAICKNLCHFLKINKKLIFDINIINNIEIKKINNKYRHINKETDVITFAFHDSKEITTFLLGEMFVSYSFCLKYAKQFGFSFEYEFYSVIIHGILHMLGFEHKTKHELNKMLKITKMILDNCHIK